MNGKKRSLALTSIICAVGVAVFFAVLLSPLGRSALFASRANVFVLALVILLAIAVAVLVANRVMGHVESVEAAQDEQLAPIEDLRASSQDVAAWAKRLAADDPRNSSRAELAQCAERIAQELQYLSPVQSAEATGMQNEIGRNLFDLGTVLRTHEFGQQELLYAQQLARDTEFLVGRRKSLRN
ncbi:MAG: hypothetical protein Q4B54_05240 [Coriobacteriales bacterium]|nr:hypothetical protein [Coriobacteriales bacterium]